MKKNDLITLESGRDFKLPFTPVKPEGSVGAQRKWVGVTDDMWQELFEALAEYKTKERNEVCKHYHVSYQKLIKTFGDNAVKTIKKSNSSNPMVRIEQIKAKIVKHEEAIVQLQNEMVDLKKAAKEQLKKQLDALDDL